MDTEKRVYRGEPDYVVSPGALLSRLLRLRNLAQGWVAEQLELSPQALRLLLCGEAPMTEEIAFGLERVLAVPASFWQKAESTYRIRKRKREERLAGVVTEIRKKKRIRELV